MRISTRSGIIIILLAAVIFAGGFYLFLDYFWKMPEISVASFIRPKTDKQLLTLVFVGDITLDRGVRQMVYKYGEGDYIFPFLKIKPHLQEADLLFGNLESIISDKGTRVGSTYSFRAEPEAIRGLTYAGFDVVSVANNHIFDYGREAMEDSFLRLKNSGIAYTGGGFTEGEAYSPLFREIKGTKIAFLAYTNLASSYWTAQEERSGIALLEEERMKKDIKKASQQADLVVVSLHYGQEYSSEPNDFQVDITQAAIEAGAHLVVGHHPHVVQPVEKYQQGYIAYSLGNFIFDQSFSEETMRGLILKVVLEDGNIKEIVSLESEINQYFQPDISSAQENKVPLPLVKNISQESGGQTVRCLYQISGVPSPKSIAFNPDGQEFWVTSLMNTIRGVVVFNAATGKHKKDIQLPDGGGVEIVFNREGSRAFVSQMETGRVFEIDAVTKEILRTFDTESSWTKVLALSFEEDLLFASNWVGNDISVIDLETGKLLKNIPVVRTPRGIYPEKEGGFLYVAGFNLGEIQKINLQTEEGPILYQGRGAMRHIAADEEKGVLYFSDMAEGVVLQLDMLTDQIKEFAQTDNNPNTIALTPDKKALIVSNRGINHPSGRYDIPGPELGTILFFNTDSSERIATLVAGNQPTGLSVSPDGEYFVYSNFLDGNLALCRVPQLLP